MPRLMVDSLRFRQLLFNYINNAVKYAGPCTIRITSTYEDGHYKLTVADNGKGVSPEKAKLLMEPFVQADIKNRMEGSGLGLAICKRLVELAHGTLTIDTALGKGFTIHVDVPVDIAPEEQASDKVGTISAIEVSNLPKRVLLVDDSPVNCAVLKAMLEEINITDIELAEDGKVALDILKRDPTFDLVMSDMWMPVMDGTELIKCIRADERLAKLKVCSITADVEARTTYREQGFDSFLIKPVTIKELMDFFAGAHFSK
jgi:CheY-like chemotaxis protein